MIYTDMTRKAIGIMFEAHKDQMDKSGVPYVFHPWHVAEQMVTEESCCAALLHDVDDHWTVKQHFNQLDVALTHEHHYVPKQQDDHHREHREHDQPKHPDWNEQDDGDIKQQNHRKPRGNKY